MTAADFATQVARLLRDAIRPTTDLYQQCLNAERANTAELYEAAAIKNEWAALPMQPELDAAKESAWACLKDAA
jgi:hypothetical protein